MPVELSDDGDDRVVLDTVLDPWANVRRRAEIVGVGDELLPAGALLTAGALAHLATHGHAHLAVTKSPRVAVLTTGDEVVSPDTDPSPGQLRDSHTDFLLAALRSLGIEGEALGIAPDRPAALSDHVRVGLEYDLLLLCGGVSMGQLDLVGPTLDGLGCENLFHGVAIPAGQTVARRAPCGADGSSDCPATRAR